jgi:(R)-citramalyl-CoA lyase
MTDAVLITEVAPRDGLQNEPEILPVATRVELIERLLAAGVRRIELGSFVNPKQVPQMAGTAEVAAEVLQRHDPAHFTALIPNLRGYELAVASGLRHVRLVLAASEALNQANFKRSVAESLADFATIAARARAEQVAFGVAIGASFGCPFEGDVPPARVRALAEQLTELGASEVVLADTTGMGVPTLVANVITQVQPVLRQEGLLTVHFHNTRNTGYANAFAAWQVGIRSFDAALGGIGGCPFAPRAVGNIATDDLVHMLNGMGVASAVNLTHLLATADWLATHMGKSLPALVSKAGPVFIDCNQENAPVEDAAG